MNPKRRSALRRILKDGESDSTVPLPNSLNRILENVRSLDEQERIKWLIDNGFQNIDFVADGPQSIRDWVGLYVKTSRLRPKKQSKWQEYVGEVAGELASLHCKRLVEEALVGDTSAITALAALTADLVKALNGMASRPNLLTKLKPIARKATAWPAMRAKREALGDDFPSLEGKLELGRDNLLAKSSESKFNPKSQLNMFLFKWLNEIESIRTFPSFLCGIRDSTKWEQAARGLPELRPETRNEWLAVIYAMIEGRTETQSSRKEVLDSSGIGRGRKEKVHAPSELVRTGKIATKSIQPTRGLVKKYLRQALDSHLGTHAQTRKKLPKDLIVGKPAASAIEGDGNVLKRRSDKWKVSCCKGKG